MIIKELPIQTVTYNGEEIPIDAPQPQPPVLQSVTITPTETEQTETPPAGVDGFDAVTVEAIPSDYVGSGVARRKAADMTVSGRKVTAPAGYYINDTSAYVNTATVSTPDIGVDANGLITATNSQSTGYVNAGTTRSTKQLDTQAEQTVAPTKEEQTIAEAGKYLTGAQKVAAIPDEYIIPSGSQTLTQNGDYNVAELESVTVSVQGETPVYDTPTINVSSGGLITASANGKSNTQQLATKAAQTITPTEAEQTLAGAGVYTTGAQKVAAIPADYIGSAVTINYYHILDAEPSPASIPEGDIVFIRG